MMRWATAVVLTSIVIVLVARCVSTSETPAPRPAHPVRITHEVPVDDESSPPAVTAPSESTSPEEEPAGDRTWVISATVVDRVDRGISDLRVEVWQVGLRDSIQTTTNGEGSFEARVRPDADIRVEITGDEIERFTIVERPDSFPERIEVVRFGCIRVVFPDSALAAMSEADVRLGPLLIARRTKRWNGGIDFSVPVGPHRGMIRGGPAAPSSFDLDVELDRPAIVRYPASDSTSIVSVRDVDTGFAVPLARIEIRRGDANVVNAVESDATGEALIYGDLDRQASLRVFADGYIERTIPWPDSRARGRRIEVSLVPGRTLDVIVRSDGSPLAGTVVRLQDDPPGHGSGSVLDLQPSRHVASTDDAGRARFDTVEPGIQRVCVCTREGWSIAERRVAIVGPGTEIEIDLQTISLGGTVRCGDDPVVGGNICVVAGGTEYPLEVSDTGEFGGSIAVLEPDSAAWFYYPPPRDSSESWCVDLGERPIVSHALLDFEYDTHEVEVRVEGALLDAPDAVVRVRSLTSGRQFEMPVDSGTRTEDGGDGIRLVDLPEGRYEIELATGARFASRTVDVDRPMTITLTSSPRHLVTLGKTSDVLQVLRLTERLDDLPLRTDTHGFFWPDGETGWAVVCAADLAPTFVFVTPDGHRVDPAEPRPRATLLVDVDPSNRDATYSVRPSGWSYGPEFFWDRHRSGPYPHELGLAPGRYQLRWFRGDMLVRSHEVDLQAGELRFISY
ncbi:MAG: carboxypeptidase regulatory-like domain-containing protein [Planctomycetes bacterium]|nr:carboxypeptidase regulatory-like domain-containing protein [Planctomycetota bacterium]